MKIGILGFGSLGQYLYKESLTRDDLEVVWVWNRTSSALESIPEDKRLGQIEDIPNHPTVDLIVEVAHPSITKNYGKFLVEQANYFAGSPTCFADAETEKVIRDTLASPQGSQRAVYVPSGAFWGAEDIFKMATLGTLDSLCITMKKHPQSLKLEGDLGEKLAQVIASNQQGEVVLYEGSVRGICPLAPNNVNTMAAGALAGFNLGFDQVQARLVSDTSLDAHVITIEAKGAPNARGECFRVSTERYNPAAVGAVTGSATYASFLSSVLLAHSRKSGLIHLC